MTTAREQAVEHALAEFPREACGFIVERNGQEEYLPCPNVAADPLNEFRIAPADYVRAEGHGTILSVVHSHPNASASPSEADRVMCELSGHAWLIIAVHRDAGDTAAHFAGDTTLRPCGYQAPLVGREFVHGVQDCFTLIADWYERERGIKLPHFHRNDNWWLNGENLYVDNYAAAGFKEVSVGTSPQVGDVFLMQVRSRVPNHAGVYIGDGQFLHHLYRQLSRRDIYGGAWAERTVLVVRYVGEKQ